MSWAQYGNWAFYVATAASVAFVLSYAVLAPWWTRPTGRNIMFVMATLAMAMVYFGFVIWQGGVTAGFYPVRAVLFTMLAASISWRVVLLIRAQLGSRADARHRRMDDHEDVR